MSAAAAAQPRAGTGRSGVGPKNLPQSSASRSTATEDDDAIDNSNGNIDRYGFLIEAEETQGNEVMQSKSGLQKLRQREMKWAQMVSQWKNYVGKQATKKNIKIFERRLRKGIPEAWRSRVWLLLLGCEERLVFWKLLLC